MEELHIRKACTSDSEFVFTVKKAAFQGICRTGLGLGRELSKGTTRETVLPHKIYALSSFVGPMSVFLATSRTRATLKVNQLYILPEYQGRGIGTACMARVLDDASLRQKPVVLQVLKVNTRGCRLLPEIRIHKRR